MGTGCGQAKEPLLRKEGIDASCHAHIPCGHSVANHLMALRRRFCALPFSAAHARSHPCRTSPFTRQARRTHPAESRSSSYGLVHHLRLLPTPPRGGAVIVSFRPESVCLERTCTSLDVCAWRRTGSACAAGRPGAAGSDRKHERVGRDGALVFPVRSGSARRFATPVEPPPFFLRFFVSLWLTRYLRTLR